MKCEIVVRKMKSLLNGIKAGSILNNSIRSNEKLEEKKKRRNKEFCTDKDDDASGDQQKETEEAGTKGVPHASGSNASPLSPTLALLITDAAGSIADDGSGTVDRSSRSSGRLQQARRTFLIRVRILLTVADRTVCRRTIGCHDNLNTAALIIHDGVAADGTKVDS